jgi:hypothetical protein
LPIKTSGEIEQELIDDLTNSTGRDLREWIVLIAASGGTTPRVVRSRARLSAKVSELAREG